PQIAVLADVDEQPPKSGNPDPRRQHRRRKTLQRSCPPHHQRKITIGPGNSCHKSEVCHKNEMKTSYKLISPPLIGSLAVPFGPVFLAADGADRERLPDFIARSKCRCRNRFWRAGRRDLRRRRHFPLPDLREMGGSLRGEDRAKDELPV